MAAVTVEQLYKWVHQYLLLWSSSTGLTKVYPQASQLAQRFDQTFGQQPGKWLAQLHHYKPHYSYLTNLTVKAIIFSAEQVVENRWTSQTRISIIAATLTANVAVLAIITQQANGKALSDADKRTLPNNMLLSYQLLKKHKVLDPLWLHTLYSAIPAKQSKTYPISSAGMILTCAYRIAKLLCRPKTTPNITVSQVLRQLYLDGDQPGIEQIVNKAAVWIHELGEGALVQLKNEQLALIMAGLADNQYLVFLFVTPEPSTKGRFVLITTEHIAHRLPCFSCDEPRIYSLLWDKPLAQYATENQLALRSALITQPNIFTPLPQLAELVSNLFEQPDLNQICDLISQSPALIQLLTTTASAATNKDIVITDPKHALLMLGLNRMGPLLTQGALSSSVAQLQFPGLSQLQVRQQCFIQAVKYYANLNDLISAEELSLYAVFWIAPLFLTPQAQALSCRLHRQKSVSVEEAFKIEKLFGINLGEHHKSQVITLAHNWQLPKLALELFRQLSNPATTIQPARKIANGLAVIYLATLHTHTIYNQVDINSPFLQQKLLQYLKVLNISLPHFIAHQDTFLLDFAPFSAL